LKDAFLQVLAALPMRKSLFVNVTFPKAGMIYSSTEARMVGLLKRMSKPEDWSDEDDGEWEPPNGFPDNLSDEDDGEWEPPNGFRSKTPIIGSRYHSTKVPNVDLCETCFTKYEGDKVNFRPEIQGKKLAPAL
jgi:hypothetical protein